MNIFIADFLPIKNKGEEALLRGIESLYQEKYQTNIEFFVFGPVESTTKSGNITSFPVSWCYPMYKSPSLFMGRFGLIHKLLCTFLFRFGIFPYISNISKHPEVITALKSADVILLAHDGFYNTFCAGLGLYLKKMEVNYSILGSGFNPIPKYNFANKRLDYKFFDYSSLSVVREQTCFKYLSNIGLNKKVYLLPDMAFYCQSREDEIEKGKLIAAKYKIGINKDIVYIGLTICENSISFHGSFLNSNKKSNDHRNFIANLLDGISKEINCKFFFIPHCIEEGDGNDLVIAEDILNRMKHKEKAEIIRDDLPVNVLRPLIKTLDFMLGERTHSIINSTSMCTPYFMLTSSLDFRSHDIIGKGVGLPNQIIDFDSPELENVKQKIITGIISRNSIAKSLENYQDVVKLSRQKLLELLPISTMIKS